MGTIKAFFSTNPMLVRALIAAAAAALQSCMGPAFDVSQAQHLVEGLLVGWALLPRPGDAAVAK